MSLLPGGESFESFEYCNGTSRTGFLGVNGEDEGESFRLGLASGEIVTPEVWGVSEGVFQGDGGRSTSTWKRGWCLSNDCSRRSDCLMVASMSPSDLLGGRGVLVGKC